MRRCFKIIPVAVVLMLLPLWMAAQDTSRQESRKARIEREIQEIESQIRENSSRKSDALTSLSLIRQKIDARKSLLAESEKELKAINDTVTVYKSQADAILARLDTMTFYYGRLVKNAYKNRDAKVWYMYLFASRSISQAGRRYSYLRNLSGRMNSQAVKIKEAQAELAVKLSELEVLQGKARLARDEQQKVLGTLTAEEAQQKKIVAQLNKEKSKYQSQLSSKRKQVEALNREIQKIIASAVGGSSSSKSGSSRTPKPQSPEDFKLSGEFASNQGRLPWPAVGHVADHFGQHYHPVYKSVKLPFNNGINITVPKGTEVKCIFDGEVKRVIVMPGYNKCVLVRHGEYFTFYCKLSSVSVKAGDKMKAGQTVGIVDTIDGQTQLHFQLWQGTKPQDPELWLKSRD